jgi:fructokinase
VVNGCVILGSYNIRYAAVEGGGTSWSAAIMHGSPDNIVERQSFVTEAPTITIPAIREWLRARQFDAIGIATFGPVDAKPSSATYGYITSTPKPGWKNTDVIGLLGMRDEFKGTPFIFDTDVNAPAIAEYNLFHQRGDSKLSSCAYITVGTGVGVGLVVNGNISVVQSFFPAILAYLRLHVVQDPVFMVLSILRLATYSSTE